MNGYILFLEKLTEFNLEYQKKIISNIFGKEVLIFNTNELFGKIFIKFYDGEVYYQFCFIFEDCDKDMEIIKKERIFIYNIYVLNIKSSDILGENIYNLIKILRDIEIDYFNSFL